MIEQYATVIAAGTQQKAITCVTSVIKKAQEQRATSVACVEKQANEYVASVYR